MIVDDVVEDKSYLFENISIEDFFKEKTLTKN